MSRSWLLLVHQLPSNPSSFRVRIWRRLQQLGAVAIKDAVYALPNGGETREDFEWLVREITDGGGEATLFVAESLAGEEIVALFHQARNRDYEEIAVRGRDLEQGLAAKLETREISPDEVREAVAEIEKLRVRLAEVGKIDYLGAPGRAEAEASMTRCAERLGEITSAADGVRPAEEPAEAARYRGRVWVTRRNVGVDRIASAWVIRRFIDTEARLGFVDERANGDPEAIFFDMFGGDFAHVEDRCTFEVLVERFGFRDPALLAISEIVHDLDLKDHKFGRPETAGIGMLLDGVAKGSRSDEEAVEGGALIMDKLYAALAVGSA